MKTLVRVAAALSFIFCLVGGLWILKEIKWGEKSDALAEGIGFYFIGKAFFVGPMLWIAGERLKAKEKTE